MLGRAVLVPGQWDASAHGRRGITPIVSSVEEITLEHMKEQL